jgi:hypothetical protein
MIPKKKSRRCLGLSLDSGLDLASLVSFTALVLRVYNVKKSAVKMYLFPARGSLASDIPSGDGKTVNNFFTEYHCKMGTYLVI